MKIRRATGSGKEKIELQMTPMIDIVFQLLIFFIMTFKIVELEGDFNIQMPLSAAPGEVDPDAFPPMKLRLRADATGEIAGITLNDEIQGSLLNLQTKIINTVGGNEILREKAEVILDFDYNLRYEHVMDAIDAVSGYKMESGDLIKLVEKIKFAPPRENSGN